MTSLSPAAQAVLGAYYKGLEATSSDCATEEDALAAALRAAADGWRAEVGGITQTDFIRGVLRSAEALDEIADELEGSDD